jgi:phosphoribosylformylglycinamidine (FGAM) synthase-like amidotransferase family enzyme
MTMPRSNAETIRRVRRHVLLVALTKRQFLTMQEITKLIEYDAEKFLCNNTDLKLVEDDFGRVSLPKKLRQKNSGVLIKSPITHGMGRLYAL